MKNKLIFCLFIVLSIQIIYSESIAANHADTLRGSNGRGRLWWHVLHYNLKVDFDLPTKTITGSNAILFKITQTPTDTLQLDLQEPLILDSIAYGNKLLPFTKQGNVWWIENKFSLLAKGSEHTLTAYWHGSPKIARNPPWDGGFTYTTDSNDKEWVAVSCQGLGASVWWPCKDAQWEEPDSGMDMTFIAPKQMQCISNGRLKSVEDYSIKNKWHWQVKNPINNYDVTFYIGDYITWHDTLIGEKGILDLDFWVLRYHESIAKQHFASVKNMLRCYEFWLGPYPFYEDGFKLVEAPYLGMEHQSAVAYGNKYKFGYLGHDRTGTGIGMNFDYITVHESAHEWFGNNITAADIADNWVQEGITTYSESLFTEWVLGKDEGMKYCRGEWNNIMNNTTIIGRYGINKEGAGDMYDKGAAIMYMIRKIVDNDAQFRKILRGLSSTFYHKTVTTAEIEDFISKGAKTDLAPFFNQYLRTTQIPEIEYYIKDKQLFYKFNNVVDGFMLSIPVTSGNINETLSFTNQWQHIKWKGGYNLHFSNDYLITVKTN